MATSNSELLLWFDRHPSDPASRTLVFIPGDIMGRTPRAVQFYDGRATQWLPKSQVKEVDGGLQIPLWLAERSGIMAG